MKQGIPHFKKKIQGFITNESGSIKRESIVQVSVGAAMVVGGIVALPDSVSAHVNSTWNPCAPSASVGHVNRGDIGANTVLNINGHFNGLGSTTHGNYGHGSFDTACLHTSHSSHGSCGGGCW